MYIIQGVFYFLNILSQKVYVRRKNCQRFKQIEDFNLNIKPVFGSRTTMYTQ